MKKIIMILCAVLFVSTCGKTTDQQIRESMVGDWVGCKNADTFSIKLTMSTVYGDDASTGTMTFGYYQGADCVPGHFGFDWLIAFDQITTGSVAEETDKNDAPNTFLNIAGFKINERIKTITLLVGDPAIAGGYWTACGGQGTPVEGDTLDVTGCTAANMPDAGTFIYMTGAKPDENTLYGSTFINDNVLVTDPNNRVGLDTEADALELSKI